MSLNKNNEEKLEVFNEVEYYRKRKYKLSKAKDIMAVVIGISIAVHVGSCVPDFSNHDSSVHYYSLGSLLGSFITMLYFDDDVKKCDEKIKKIGSNIE